MPYSSRPLVRAIAIAAIGISLIGASDATTVTSQDASPVAAVCDVEPRSAGFLVDLISQPLPETTPQPLTGVPDGSDEVDQETRAAVIAILEELTACVNAGELLRAFALFDDSYLRRVIDPEGLMTDNVAAELGQSFATPEAVGAENAQAVEEILLVRELADSSIAIVFRSRVGPEGDGGESRLDLLVMQEIDGLWLIIDGVTDLDPDQLADG